MRKFSFLLAFSSIAFSTIALTSLARPCTASEPSHTVTVSFSRLLASMAEVRFEQGLSPNTSVSLLASGGGSGRDDKGLGGFGAVGGGLQAVWYAWGSFGRGIQLGAETRYEFRHSTARSEGLDITGNSHGAQVGALFGGKWTARSGLVFQVQTGARWLWTSTTTTCCTTTRLDSSTRGWRGLLGVNLGWAF